MLNLIRVPKDLVFRAVIPVKRVALSIAMKMQIVWNVANAKKTRCIQESVQLLKMHNANVIMVMLDIIQTVFTVVHYIVKAKKLL